MDNIMRKTSHDAAEFCLLSAPSRLPLLLAGTPEGDYSDSGNIYCLGNIKIRSFSIHRAVESHFTLLSISFPDQIYKIYSRIAGVELQRITTHSYFSSFPWFKSDHTKREIADTFFFFFQEQTSGDHLMRFLLQYLCGECPT